MTEGISLADIVRQLDIGENILASRHFEYLTIDVMYKKSPENVVYIFVRKNPKDCYFRLAKEIKLG